MYIVYTGLILFFIFCLTYMCLALMADMATSEGQGHRFRKAE